VALDRELTPSVGFSRTANLFDPGHNRTNHPALRHQAINAGNAAHVLGRFSERAKLKKTAPMSRNARFAILAYEDVEPIDVGAAYGVLSMARRILPSINMFLVGAHPGPTRLANGLVVDVAHGYKNCPPAEVVIVTGGPGWERQTRSAETLQFIQERAQHSMIASICTGAMILAAAGLLDGLAATTRSCGTDSETVPLEMMKITYGRVKTVEAVIVDNGSIITGGGVTLGIDTMLYILGKLFGSDVADDVARMMAYTHARKANRSAIGYVLEEKHNS